MLALVNSAAVLGIDAYLVQVQVDVSRGMPRFNIVGLPDAGVQESRERVRAAVRNSQFDFPYRRITVNLAPADVRKAGPAFDLPIALGILAATEQLATEDWDDFLAVGELSLDGAVRGVSGVLPITLGAKEAGKRKIIVPAANVAEASVVEGIEVYPVESLYEASALIGDWASRSPAPPSSGDWDLERPEYEMDLSEVKGQAQVKRALEVAAAGGHNVLMIGPPGAGKTMMARRLPSILPTLSLEEALEVTKIYSIADMLPSGTALITTRPFRSPHHTVSTAGLVGGGTIPRPGEVSLAHYGVLFLDEFPEFHRDALEVLRQPLEDGEVTITRAEASLTFPARLMMVAAMNPCPCGYFSDATHECTCSHHQIQRYLRRISGPLLDRIDIHVEVPRLKYEELSGEQAGEPSTAVRERVERSRKVQRERFQRAKIFCNAHMGPKHLPQFCPLSDEVQSLLRGAIDQLSLSARAYHRIIKLARTIADLEGSPDLAGHHVAESIQYRSLDRKIWA